MTRHLRFILIAFAVLSTAAAPEPIQRFPKPDFESGYERPIMQTPASRALTLEYLDVVVLIAALSLASYFVLKKRSRRYLFVLMLFSLIYFGFWRKGCVCSVGSVQNVVLAMFSNSYAIPLTVVAFFLLPLVFTLFFGRTFCAAVCPLGAAQDIFILKPKSLPGWLNETLSLIPYLYLGLSVLFAATGAGFLICRYDPFVGFFRFGASFDMILFGAFLLLLGTVVARPYCRFLCPYGVLLNWMSQLSRKHLSITPAECINCRLCEASCPFDAIKMPTAKSNEKKEQNTRRLALLLVLTPLVMALSGWAGSLLHVPLSRGHFTVALAEEIRLEDTGQRTERTDETDVFRATGKSTALLYEEARQIQRQFRTGGWLLGGFLGLIFCLKMIKLAIPSEQSLYEANRGTCLSCGRCLSYCPVGKEGVDVERIPQG
ncbi:4Fe-4S binding protein [candidate division KSB1 bacterium]|nr:4Fe-4S binding protein [candidate division KSB1 bacterium]RQW06451.1 MAG: 4Fe-4S binding protein [candidate division KSB1 bacterium]